jgi:hypothetical protein
MLKEVRANKLLKEYFPSSTPWPLVFDENLDFLDVTACLLDE